jgi:Asp-tRNA(Asn)/Glu-tRNA(Gln) amidotransferase A subunit family amidase
VFANSAQDLALGVDAISGEDGIDPTAVGVAPTRLSTDLARPLARPRLAFLRGPTWDEVTPGCAKRYEELAASLGAEPVEMGAEFADIVEAHQTVMFAEIGHNMWPLYERAGTKLSEMMRGRLVKGEAPLGLQSTGSRMQTLAWTTLGVPAVNVPGMVGPNGLPIGVQVVGRRGEDGAALRAAAWLGQHISST